MPALVWDVRGNGRDVFLTFDDGPTPGITEWILDELGRFGAKATFFCLGKNAEAHPDLMERIVREGHRIGNHSYGHLKGWRTSPGEYLADVERADLPLHSDLFRPPYGSILPGQARLLAGKYKIVMWNIISRDYNRRLSRHTCLNNVIKHVRVGDIIVFHDSEKAFRNLRFALPRTLKYLQDNDMTSKTIEL